eukprot:scaffold21328_cov57-Phaeocystis_antarctica.AAC.1
MLPTGRRPGGGGGGGGVLLAGSPAEKSCQERALATQSKIVFSIEAASTCSLCQRERAPKHARRHEAAALAACTARARRRDSTLPPRTSQPQPAACAAVLGPSACATAAGGPPPIALHAGLRLGTGAGAQHGQRAPLGSAPARLLCLLGVAPGSSAVPGPLGTLPLPRVLEPAADSTGAGDDLC